MKIVDSKVSGVKIYSAPARIVRIPFSQNASEKATNVVLMKGDVVEDCRIYVTTNVAASTIDVGLNGSTHDDPDGLIDGASCVNAGWVAIVDNTELASKVSALLQSGADGIAAVAANEAGPQGLLITEDNCPVTYTTSAHAIAGFIYLKVRSLDEGANAYA